MAAAAAMADLTVYNMPPSPPNLDRLGVFYIAFCITWTTILIAGMVFCVWNRRNPIIRVRAISLSFPAIVLLHLYWILGQLVYPVGASMPTVLAYDVQYFGMGVWFPLGIALFQASNLRFLHVAKMQKQYVYPELRAERRCNGGGTSWLCRLRNMDYMKRTMIFIGIGMAVQVCPPLLICLYVQARSNPFNSSSLRSQCGWHAASITQHTASLAQRLKELQLWSKLSILVVDGNGGNLFCGRLSGHGLCVSV